MTRWAHSDGTGGSKMRPFGNWAATIVMATDAKHTKPMNVFMIANFVQNLLALRKKNF